MPLPLYTKFLFSWTYLRPTAFSPLSSAVAIQLYSIRAVTVTVWLWMQSPQNLLALSHWPLLSWPKFEWTMNLKKQIYNFTQKRNYHTGKLPLIITAPGESFYFTNGLCYMSYHTPVTEWLIKIFEIKFNNVRKLGVHCSRL